VAGRKEQQTGLNYGALTTITCIVNDEGEEIFGVKLRRAREKARLSQRAVAERIDPPVTQHWVSAVENGTQSPKENSMRRLARAVGKRLIIELVDC